MQCTDTFRLLFHRCKQRQEAKKLSLASLCTGDLHSAYLLIPLAKFSLAGDRRQEMLVYTSTFPSFASVYGTQVQQQADRETKGMSILWSLSCLRLQAVSSTDAEQCQEARKFSEQCQEARKFSERCQEARKFSEQCQEARKFSEQCQEARKFSEQCQEARKFSLTSLSTSD